MSLDHTSVEISTLPECEGVDPTTSQKSWDILTDDEAQRQYLIELDRNVENSQYLGKQWAIVNRDWYEAWLAFWCEPDEVRCPCLIGQCMIRSDYHCA
jgi:hypothetical protein